MGVRRLKNTARRTGVPPPKWVWLPAPRPHPNPLTPCYPLILYFYHPYFCWITASSSSVRFDSPTRPLICINTKMLAFQIVSFYTAVAAFVAARSPISAAYQQPLPHVETMSENKATPKVPGNNDAIFGPIPKDSQLFEVEFLEIAPSPIPTYVSKALDQIHLRLGLMLCLNSKANIRQRQSFLFIPTWRNTSP